MKSTEHEFRSILLFFGTCPISFLVTWLTSFLQREKMAVLTRGTKFLNLLLLLLLIYYERLSNNY